MKSMADKCGVCQSKRSDLIALTFRNESKSILHKMKRFIDKGVSVFFNFTSNSLSFECRSCNFKKEKSLSYDVCEMNTIP